MPSAPRRPTTCLDFVAGYTRPRLHIGGEILPNNSNYCAPICMAMRMVSFRGRAFAYTQDSEVHAWPQDHLVHLPQASRAIDSFFGCVDD
jgi:hypothetical protein